MWSECTSFLAVSLEDGLSVCETVFKCGVSVLPSLLFPWKMVCLCVRLSLSVE